MKILENDLFLDDDNNIMIFLNQKKPNQQRK